jgi:LysM repeat protein
MMLMVVLGAILYGVYVVLNKGPAPEPPAGAGRDWTKPVGIQPGEADDSRVGQSPMTMSRPGERTDAAGSDPYGRPNSDASAAADSRGEFAAPAVSQAPARYPSKPSAGDPFHQGDASRNEAPRNDAAGAPAGPFSQQPPDPAAVFTPRGDPMKAPAPAQESFAAALESAKGMLNDGKLVESLRKLTKWYNSPQLSPEDSRQLNELLSQLAGTVVYSRQHLLQPAYKIQAGDRLETIAAQYKVPWQLLAKINGIDDPNRLVPGDELKVVRGPFTAIVDLEKRQLTLIVEDCYAGRFSLVAVGEMARSLDGNFEVGEKSLDGRSGGNGAASRAANSPIHHWIGLGNNMGIVGTSDAASIHPAGLNLNSRDAEDVYDILSMGSRVVVRR